MIAQVSPNDLAAWAASTGAPGPAVVIDVREPWELATASVSTDGFELIAIPMGDIPARLAELDAGRAVACLCHHGMRSLRVANFLAQQGFAHVANLAGGIDRWSAERDPQVPRY